MKRICLKCNKEFTFDANKKYQNKFCSSKCSHSRIIDKEKHSIAAKKAYNLGRIRLPHSPKDPLKWKVVKCLICQKEFEVYKNRNAKFCSYECSNKNPQLGGYREGSGRSKCGYYKGIYCGSTYELVWVIYRLDHNLLVKRFEGKLHSSKYNRKYIPDFIVDNKTFVEIKGYEDQFVTKEKIEIAKENGYDVILLKKENLTEEFEWVKNNYFKTSHLEELYDDYKMPFKYECNFCKNTFETNNKRREEKHFCNVSCAMKYRHKKDKV